MTTDWHDRIKRDVVMYRTAWSFGTEQRRTGQVDRPHPLDRSCECGAAVVPNAAHLDGRDHAARLFTRAHVPDGARKVANGTATMLARYGVVVHEGQQWRPGSKGRRSTATTTHWVQISHELEAAIRADAKRTSATARHVAAVRRATGETT